MQEEEEGKNEAKLLLAFCRTDRKYGDFV